MRYAIVAGLALLACGCTTTDSAATGAAAAVSSPAGAQACTSFDSSKLGLAGANASYVQADATKGLPAFCEVKGTLHPVAGSNIGVVYRLPDNWNGKVYGIGGGGWAGGSRRAGQTRTGNLGDPGRLPSSRRTSRPLMLPLPLGDGTVARSLLMRESVGETT